MRIKHPLFLVLIIIGTVTLASFIPLANGTTPTPFVRETVPRSIADLYFRNEVQVEDSLTSYVMNTTRADAQTYTNTSLTGNISVSWGFRTYVYTSGSYLEFTNGVTTLGTINAGGSSSITHLSNTSSTFTTPLLFGHSQIVVRIYVNLNSTGWSLLAVFSSGPFYAKQIIASTYTLNLYVQRTYVASTTNEFIYWADPDTPSGMSNLVYRTPTATDWQSEYLGQSNFAMFVMIPYTLVLGNVFYGIIFLAVCFTLKLRYRSLSTVAIFVFLMAACFAGGGFNLVVGELITGLVWLIAAFGLGALYWKVFR